MSLIPELDEIRETLDRLGIKDVPAKPIQWRLLIGRTLTAPLFLLGWLLGAYLATTVLLGDAMGRGLKRWL